MSVAEYEQSEAVTLAEQCLGSIFGPNLEDDYEKNRSSTAGAEVNYVEEEKQEIDRSFTQDDW